MKHIAIQMNEIEYEQFNKMVSQQKEMIDMLGDLKEAMVGNPTYKRPGIIDDINSLKTAVQEHDKSDNEKFDKLFEFQKKQQLFAGWTGIAIKSVWAIAMIALTYYLPKIFG